MKKYLECCVDSIASIKVAKAAGVDRIELCSSLELGGLTPSAGLVAVACEVGVDIHVMIRPRGGDFCYSEDEIAQMERDIIELSKYPVSGFVFGALNEDCTVDMLSCKRLVSAVSSRRLTFHRAFDLIADKKSALEDLIDLGFNFVLTSGGEDKAINGADMISELVEFACGRIRVMAGSGVNSENIRKLAEKTKAIDFHASAAKIICSRQSSGLKFGSSEGDETVIKRADEVELGKLVDILNE